MWSVTLINFHWILNKWNGSVSFFLVLCAKFLLKFITHAFFSRENLCQPENNGDVVKCEKKNHANKSRSNEAVKGDGRSEEKVRFDVKVNVNWLRTYKCFDNNWLSADYLNLCSSWVYLKHTKIETTRKRKIEKK